MPRTIALLLVVTAIAGAACHRETKKPSVTTTTMSSAYGMSPDTAPRVPAGVPPQAANGINVGDAMPAFEAPLLDGAKFDVAKEKGNVVLLNLWATWCGPCREEIPELEQMHKQHSGDGFKVVGISLDEGELDAVKEFVRTHGMTYPIALDPEGKLTGVFQTGVIPTTVLIDRNGTIAWKKYGMIERNDSTLQAALKKALAEKRS
ncbi:MAG: alkyl hydroperoxide reductase/Thiol specific antioxidant/Mal allergen [Acidobacteria bacterium]|nr:alkyl hydroperoxide reductase/Thiol specific antioxidant/Mal allergen [Acidobacteriota bacterium]